jgi:Zn finger protein HypA/HybF involved in hydrogenase expression
VTLDLHTQGFLDALGRIDARKEREKMQHKKEIECPNCYQVYKADDFVTCPSCDVNPDIEILER